LIHNYFGLRLPNVKIAVTGSGRVAHGILEIMNLMGIHEVEPDDYLKRRFSYPVYTQLKGAELYERKDNGKYSREEFHNTPELYKCKFLPYAQQTDILMNGVYWEKNVPRLFEKPDVHSEEFIIQTIADITDDANGSVPINLGDQSIEDPVYGVDKNTLEKTAPYIPGSIDIMAVGNLPNELPRDASRYFGEQLIKYVLDDLVNGSSRIIERATIAKNGQLTKYFEYLEDYVSA
jgi:saccharopine dehydrogenase (NAD+, L-lysine forming)